MKLLILLDFDGVLFNSAYEAFRVCEHVATVNESYRRPVSFDEFMRFRAYLSDAWQFGRLYHVERHLKDFSRLDQIVPDSEDWSFSRQFFEARGELLQDPDWAKLMSPYPFFYQLRPLLAQHPDSFRILSTRNIESIRRTLSFFQAEGVAVHGQEDIRSHGSKLGVARHNGWLTDENFVVYIDDTTSHLESFEAEVDLCLHAGWGYDVAHSDSFTQGQAFQILDGFVRLVHQPIRRAPRNER